MWVAAAACRPPGTASSAATHDAVDGFLSCLVVGVITIADVILSVTPSSCLLAGPPDW